MKNIDLKTAVKITLLIGLGWFLASRLIFGTLNFYIHPRFNGLTLGTAIILFLLGVAYWWQKVGRKEFADEHDHDHHHDHDYHHGHSHDIPWSGLFILAIPILLGLFVQPRPLGANALDNRELNFSLTAAQGSNLRDTTIETDGPRNILDWLYDFQRQQDAALFNNREADVVGFVYRDERFGEDQFMVSRFTISCCVADANPIGLIVATDDAPQLTADSWVQVTGKFQVQSFDGQMIPVLIADSITAVDAPSQPYLYE
ncbi:MAG: TIGR03943 family protein [Chloroflexota bacterium]